jgi:DNA adenine methylase
MELLTKQELLTKCESLGINKCKSKKKSELIDLINAKLKPSQQIKLIIEDDDEDKKDENDEVDESKEKNTIISEANLNFNQKISYEKEQPYFANFLKSLKNKNGTYKRICISPLRYAGGKSKAIGLILDNLPKLKEKKIVSPFFGGGSVELCLSQMLGIEVIGYDIFNMLANFWKTLITQKDEFINELVKFKITEEEFTYNRHVLLNYWEKIKPESLNYKTKNKILLKEEDLTKLDQNSVMQAVYYYYNMTLSYGPMFLGWPSSNEINKEKFERRIEKLQKMNLTNLQVNCGSFEEVLEKHTTDFLFLDPPYYLEGDSKMFKGMYPNCNFAIHHNNFDHIKLAEMLKNHKGGFLMTYNNCSTIRELYNDCLFEYPEWQYTYGQGETRIGKNREQATKDNIKESHEIIIIKWA